MSIRTASLAGGIVIGTALSLGTAAPALAAPCDAYSGVCPTPPSGPIGGGNGGPATGNNGGPATGNNGGPATGNNGGPATGNNGGPGGGAPVVGNTANEGRSLPFTGAELILTTMLGGAAVAGGTVLVLAGRRRARNVA